MKKNFIVAVALVLSATYVNGQQLVSTVNKTQPFTPSFEAEVKSNEENTSFNLRIDNPSQKKLRVTISHQNYGVAVDTLISSQAYNRSFSLKNAEDGKYVIQVKCKKEKYRKEIELNTVAVRNVTIL